MKKILVYINANNGCVLHRLAIPYSALKQITEDYTVEFYTQKGEPSSEVLKYASEFDFFVFHSIIPRELFDGLKKEKTTVIFDVDDYWVLTSSHPLWSRWRDIEVTPKLIYFLKNSDYVTCTTELLASKVRLLNKNVKVFPNALQEFEQFYPHPTPSDKIRFGIVCSASHTKDMELLDGVVHLLSPSVLSKCQFVLCGFDKGTNVLTDEAGNTIGTEPMEWSKNCWTRFEQILTDNYRTISDEHRQFLNQHINQSYTTDEPYRRVWTKNIAHYAEHYDEIDVLLVPLVESEFNRYKSELKMIEASVKHKAVIISDVEPYHRIIQPNINCIAVNNRKRARGWAKAITQIVENPTLINTMSENLQTLTEDGGEFNLTKVTEDRIKWFNSL